MTLTEYFEWMFTAGTEAAFICIGITAFFILAAFGEMLNGFRRGVGRQLFHLMLSVIAIFISFAITERAVTELHTLFSDYTVEQMLATVESYVNLSLNAEVRAALVGIDAHLAELILTLPMATLVAPILFTVLYAIINLLVKIIYWTLGKLVPKARSLGSRGLGMIVGVAEGAAVSAIVLLPFMAFCQVTDGAVDRITSEGNEDSAIVEMHSEFIGPMSETPIFKLTAAIGGDAMLDSFAKVDLGEGEVDLREDMFAAVDIVDSMLLLTEADYSALTPEEKSAIDRMVSSVDTSPLWSEIFAEIFVTLSESSSGVSSAEDGELMAVIVDDMLYIFSTSTKDNIGGDLATFKELFFILSDEGVLAAYNEGSTDSLLGILASKDEGDKAVISRIMATLTANARTAPLADTLMKLSVSVMAESLGLGADAAELYVDVKDGIGDIVSIDYSACASDAEYEEKIAESIGATLTDAGITVSDEALADMAGAAADICKENDFSDLSDAQVNDIILEYYNSYADLIPQN